MSNLHRDTAEKKRAALVKAADSSDAFWDKELRAKIADLNKAAKAGDNLATLHQKYDDLRAAFERARNAGAEAAAAHKQAGHVWRGGQWVTAESEGG